MILVLLNALILCKYIFFVFFLNYEFYHDTTIMDVLSHHMISCINMLRTLNHRIVGDKYCTSIIHHDMNWDTNLHMTKIHHILYINHLFVYLRYSYILGFSGGRGYRPLMSWLPENRVIFNEDVPSSDTLLIVWVTRPITVSVTHHFPR